MTQRTACNRAVHFGVCGRNPPKHDEIVGKNIDEVNIMPTLRTFTNDDLLAYKRLCSICYTYPDAGEAEPQTEEQLHAMRGVFAEDGRLLSAMTQHSFDSLFCGHPVKMCGIGGVVTDPTARAGGNIRQIFETDLPRLYQEGHVFSALYPFSYHFYGKFGYTWAEFWRNVEVPAGSLRKDLARADEIIRILPGEDDQGMRAVHEKYIANKQLPILRTDWMWNDLRKGMPWETLKHAYVLRIGGKPVAYWIGQMSKENGSGKLRILDMAWTCAQGMEAIFAMIRGMNEVEMISLRAYPGFDARLLVTEAYDVTEHSPGTAMLRVINAERALSLLPAPPVAGEVTIRVTDGQITDNCGCFTVRSDGERLTVERNGKAPQIECSIQGLTALVAGRQPFGDTVDAGVVSVRDELDHRFASLLFPVRRLHINRNF